MPGASFWYFMKNQYLKFKGLVCFLIFGYGLLNIDITIKKHAPSSWGEILEVKRGNATGGNIRVFRIVFD